MPCSISTERLPGYMGLMTKEFLPLSSPLLHRINQSINHYRITSNPVHQSSPQSSPVIRDGRQHVYLCNTMDVDLIVFLCVYMCMFLLCSLLFVPFPTWVDWIAGSNQTASKGNDACVAHGTASKAEV